MDDYFEESMPEATRIRVAEALQGIVAEARISWEAAGRDEAARASRELAEALGISAEDAWASKMESGRVPGIGVVFQLPLPRDVAHLPAPTLRLHHRDSKPDRERWEITRTDRRPGHETVKIWFAAKLTSELVAMAARGHMPDLSIDSGGAIVEVDAAGRRTSSVHTLLRSILGELRRLNSEPSSPSGPTH